MVASIKVRRTALRRRFSHASRARIGWTPVQRFGIGMDPEEALMPSLAMSLSNRTASILVQKLANHRLRDRMDDPRVCCHAIPRHTRAPRRAFAIHTRTSVPSVVR